MATTCDGGKAETVTTLFRYQRQVIDRVRRWLDAKEIKAVVDWSQNLLAHSAGWEVQGIS